MIPLSWLHLTVYLVAALPRPRLQAVQEQGDEGEAGDQEGDGAHLGAEHHHLQLTPLDGTAEHKIQIDYSTI